MPEEVYLENHRDSYGVLRVYLEKIDIAPARKEALDVINREISEGPKTDAWLERNSSLLYAAGVARSYWSQKNYLQPSKGYGELANEFKQMADAMTAAAGALHGMSESARGWLFHRHPHHGFLEDVADILSWDRCQAFDAFEEPHLALRLSQLGEVLKGVEGKVREEGLQKNGVRKVFDDPPIDLDLFDLCAKALKTGGKTLQHLRPIVEAVYAYATREEAPRGDWAARQEKSARKQHRVHTPPN